MKRFTRWSMLVVCVLLSGIWIWSIFHSDSLQIRISDDHAIMIESAAGTIFFNPDSHAGSLKTYLTEIDLPNPIHNFPRILGLRLPGYISNPIISSFSKQVKWYTIYHIPIWLLLTPLLLLTLKLWYAPLKAWWRGTSRKGFEVEMKPDPQREEG